MSKAAAVSLFGIWTGVVSAEITLTCAPSSTLINPGDLVTFECTILSSSEIEVAGVQIDLPCMVPATPPGTGALQATRVRVVVAHQNPPFLFFVEMGKNDLIGQGVVNPTFCRASATPGLDEPQKTVLSANTVRYVATFVYQSSNDAMGTFAIEPEGRNEPPRATDLTRVFDLIGLMRPAYPFTWIQPAVSVVPSNCPAAALVDIRPESGIVDARQPSPHQDDSLAARTGIGSSDEPIQVNLGVTGAAGPCFTLCETMPDVDLGENEVLSAVEEPEGVYTVVLARPITSGAVSVLSYDGAAIATYVSHPGNSDAGPKCDGDDVEFLGKVLIDGDDAPYEEYSYDMNHNGAGDLGDVLAAINLINGAEEYAEWGGSDLPTNTTCR